MSDLALVLSLSARSRLSLATEHADLPSVHELTVTNTGRSRIERIELSIALEPSCGAGWTETLSELGPGQTKRFERPRLVMSPDALRTLTETQKGVVHATARAGELTARTELPITLLPASHWPGSDAPLALLASFVQWSPRLQVVVHKAATKQEQATGTRTFDSYQSGVRQRVVDQVQAIWMALCAEGIDYLSPPPSFETNGQKVLPPGEVLEGRAGACLDLSVLLATLLERVGLHAVIILVEGHAFAGVWLDGTPYSSPIHDSCTAVRKAVDGSELLVLETTELASKTELPKARRVARAHLDDSDKFLFLLDIKTARESFKPLPFDGAKRDGAVIPPPPPPQTRWSDTTVSEREQFDAETVGRPQVEARLEAWKVKLLDLTLHNRFLHFREGKLVARLLCPDPAAVEDWLAAGRRVPVVPRPELRGEVDAAYLKRRAVNLAERQEVLSDHTQHDLGRRLLELYRSGLSSLEESGAVTTYLVLGMLRWVDKKSPDKTRHAPLLVVPITLHRGKSGEPFELERSDAADTQLNVTLLTYLKMEYGLEHPGLGSDALPEDDSGVDVPLLLQRFRELVRSQAEWEVEDRAVLAPLTFKKFLMYKDLVASTEALMQNEVVRCVLTGDEGGFGLERPLLEEHELDGELSPAEVLPVLPADPSQLAAVAASAHGSSFVLQGPPGTGKSQTITNLIADTLARGQTVLFVAEKKAAIEVVHRRLQAVGLGPFALELHSDKASKKKSIEQLRAAIAQYSSREPEDWEAVADELSDLREELNDFACAMRGPSVSGLGIPVHAVIARLIGLRDVPSVPVSFRRLSSVDCRRQDAAVEKSVGILQRVGAPGEAPWRWARLEQAAPDLRAALAAVLDGIHRALDGVEETSGRLPAGWWSDGTAAERSALAVLAQQVATAGELPAGLLAAPDAAEVDGLLAELQAQADARTALWQPLENSWDPALLTETAQRSELQVRFERWAGVFLFGWLLLWGARKQLVRFASGALASSVAVRDDLRVMEQTARADAGLANRDAEARAVLGSLWKREQTDWTPVQELWERVKSLRQARLAVAPAVAEVAGRMVREQRERLLPGSGLSQSLTGFADACAGLETAWAAVAQLTAWAPESPAVGTVAELRGWLAAARSSGASGLRDWTAWQRARSELCREGLKPLVTAMEEGALAVTELPIVLERSRAMHAWNVACTQHPGLMSFQGLTHDRLIERFRRVDRSWEQLTRRLVQARIAARMPDPDAPGEMAVIRRQLQLKRNHIPLRRLFREVPTAMRALKPVVLMSPLAVARYLDPEGAPFDLVLFDEASQIPPWDAIGAIARGRRSIVVGDTRQLPPTAFFTKGDSEDEHEDPDKMVDMESILEEAISSGLHELSLKWHYRSRHESLITFSNRSYYDNGLLTFPSARHTATDLGVTLVPVPHGHYDRGGSRTNLAEAEAIVRWIQDWACQPEASRGSVGVVTFNVNQQRLIENLLDKAAGNDSVLESARHAGDESLFVKNLENVQGDERDNILFSICYAPDRGGRLSQNYGPLNRKGGERRLNVAVTRARRHMRVFSTLRHDQIQLSQTRAVGVQHLRTFLDFARRGVVALDEATHLAADAQTESPFEDAVLDVLQEWGWSVVPQVGCSGYRIDLAVEDPTRLGSFLLAVECDGATYHSSTSARARDRQRQEVLEGLGWRFHRIWSTDWWHDRPGELVKLERALEAAEAAAEEAAAEAAAAAERREAMVAAVPEVRAAETRVEAVHVGPPALTRKPSQPRFEMPRLREGCDRADLLGMAGGGLWLTGLVDAVGPVHTKPAYRWLVDSAALETGSSARLTKSLRQDCDGLVDQLVRAGRLERHGDFLWPVGRREEWRGWRLAGERTAPEVPPEEVRNAALGLLRSALAVPQEELVRALARSMGFARMGSRVQAQMAAGVAMVLAEGSARVEGGKVLWVR